MLRTIALTLAGSGAVVLSAGIPDAQLVFADWGPQQEPQAMLLLATGLFAAASVLRRVRKPPRPRS